MGEETQQARSASSVLRSSLHWRTHGVGGSQWGRGTGTPRRVVQLTKRDREAQEVRRWGEGEQREGSLRNDPNIHSSAPPCTGPREHWNTEHPALSDNPERHGRYGFLPPAHEKGGGPKSWSPSPTVTQPGMGWDPYMSMPALSRARTYNIK